MAVDEIKQLLDLLQESPGVAEFCLAGRSGGKVSIKRQSKSFPPTIIEREYRQSEGTAVERSFTEEDVAIKPSSISATLVGLFHETSPPLIAGSQVVVGQIVGYIESMRLMNEVVSSFDGLVEVASVSEGDPVEYGQPLFTVVVR